MDRDYQKDLERFFAKINKKSGNGCWEWTGTKNSSGYGQTWYNGRHQYSHRVSFEISNNCSILPGVNVLHHCDNPCCVNPSHLFLGTQRDNIQDMMKKHGHYSRVNPERLARGKFHGSRTKPEKRPRGENHYNAKLTEKQVLEIRREYAKGNITQKALGDKYGVSYMSIKHIVTFNSWKRVGISG